MKCEKCPREGTVRLLAIQNYGLLKGVCWEWHAICDSCWWVA